MAPRMTKRGRIAAGMSSKSDASSASILEEVGRLLSERRSAFRGFLLRRLSDETVAEDVLQQSLMRAVERYRDLKNTDSAVSWFYRILRNAVVDHYRAQAADARKTEGLLRDTVAAGETRTLSLDEVRPTVCACLEAVMHSMRPSYAELIRRIDLQGNPPADVARDLSVTTNTLTVRLHRARRALKAKLEEICGVCTKHGCLNCTCG